MNAFDKVSHDSVMSRLLKYGLPDASPGYQINLVWYLRTGLVGISLHLAGNRFLRTLFSGVHHARGQEIRAHPAPLKSLKGKSRSLRQAFSQQ